MKSSLITFTVAIAATLQSTSAVCGTPATASSAPPVEAFFDYPLLSEPILSPSGDAIAVEMRANGRRVLAVIDTATLKKILVVAKFDGADVGGAQWVNNNRLVFKERFEDGPNQQGTLPGLFAVNRDGSDSRMLIHSEGDGGPNSETGSNIKSRVLTADYGLMQTLQDNSNDVIIEHAIFKSSGGTSRYHDELQHLVPLRLNTLTGEISQIVDIVPEHAQDWTIDDHGRAQSVLTLDGGKVTLLAPENKKWRTVTQFDAYQTAKDGIDILGLGVDGQLYVTRATSSAARTQALYRFDMASGHADAEPLVNVAGFDFVGSLVEDHCRHKVLGVRYVADAAASFWFDPAMKQAQAKIDARLPGRANRIDVASCGDGSTLLVTSGSDQAPPQYLLYHPVDDSLQMVAVSRPDIDPHRMAMTDFYRIKARDGREFPVYVTKPAGKGPWPTVVLVHGGPTVRGWSWEWDRESQFLASRGYLVVKPEFRGSKGYGDDLMMAGFRQWGLAMQDDVADATRWAAAQGFADPARTCIAGGSYGGYATLMGLVRYPELYRCGVATSAVADIAMMYDTWWSDGTDDWKSYGMPVVIGDPAKDAAQFDATSPLKLATRITRPLLLEHGGIDRRVPVEQADAMHSALQNAHAPVTWVLYPNEGHGLYIREDIFDFHRREEAFLAANIGPGATPPAAAATTTVTTTTH